jgi:chromosomal replication initiator protein
MAAPIVGHLPRVRADFTFSNFAVSTSNQLAFVSAERVAKNTGKSYNPFFIYGPVGVGKTHLMHAIANEVYRREPDKKIIYITSEEFTNEVVEAIRNNETAKMKRRFRSAYLLLIDDIQFIEGKEKVQEELFHTFNILIDNGSQIALSSDRPPQEIKKLEKRLSSRFAGGLTVDIGAPDFELKTAIVLIKAKKYGFELPIDVAKILAESAEDTRTLEGLLIRIITQATTTDSAISVELAKQALGTVAEEKSERLHAEDIVKYVCLYYNVKPTQLKGPKRDAGLVRARQVTMYLLKEELRLTQVEIGNLLGGRDHTTIMHGVDKIRDLVENKDIIHEDIKGIIKQFRR